MWERKLSLAWNERRTNEEVSGEKRELLKIVREKQLKCLSHIAREGDLEYDTLTEVIEGIRARERKK